VPSKTEILLQPLRFDFCVSKSRREVNESTSLSSPLRHGTSAPRVGQNYQAVLPPRLGSNEIHSSPSVLQLAAQDCRHGQRSWQPLWLRHVGASRYLDSWSDASSLIDSFCKGAIQVATDWRVGMRVGVPVRDEISESATASGSPRAVLETGVLLSWNSTHAANMHDTANICRAAAEPGTSLLVASPPPGTAFVAVMSSSSVLQVSLSALHVQDSDLIVSREIALQILLQRNLIAPSALAEVERQVRQQRSLRAQSTGLLYLQAREQRLTLGQSLKLLAGCVELALLPHPPLVAPIVSAASAATVTSSSSPWTYAQQLSFAYNYNRHGKIFQLYLVPKRSVRDCVEYYYRHKHFRMCVTGMGFTSRNPSLSRWKVMAAASATAPSASVKDRSIVKEFGWKYASSSSEESGSEADLDEKGSAQAAASKDSLQTSALSSESSNYRSARPVAPPTRSGAGSGVIFAPAVPDRVSHLQLAAAMVACGSLAVGEVLAMLRNFRLLHFDPARDKLPPACVLELSDLRLSQRPVSALDPTNAQRACTGCSKFSVNALVCCNPKCGIVACESCFRSQVRSPSSTILSLFFCDNCRVLGVHALHSSSRTHTVFRFCVCFFCRLPLLSRLLLG
jgi:hypothetical protein